MIRPATPADLPGLGRAIRAAYAPFIDAGLELPPVDQGLDDELRDNHVWVAVGDDAILGCVVLVVDGRHAHLVNLAVQPDEAGNGLGRKLIVTALDAARDMGCEDIALATHCKMTATRAFYARLGWVETGQDGNKVFMSFTLLPKDAR